MSQYASTIAAMEADLQTLDTKRAQLITAIGALRVLAGPSSVASTFVPTRGELQLLDAPAEAAEPAARPTRMGRPRRASGELSPQRQGILDKLKELGAPTAPGRLADILDYEGTTLRFHVKPLVDAGLVIELGGLGPAKRYALPGWTLAGPTVAPTPNAQPAAPAVSRPYVPSSTRTDDDLEPVWNGSKGSPSLTGDASGLGSSLSGITHAVVRSR